MKQLFETIGGLISPGTDLTIVVRKNSNGQLIVSTNVRNTNTTDAAKELIAPFVVSGSPAELDAEFAGLISAPVEQSAGIQTSMENFEASAKAAKAKSAAADAQKKEISAKASKILSTAENLKSQKKYSEAINLLQTMPAEADAASRSKAKALLEECKSKNEPDIFSMNFDGENNESPTEKKQEETPDEQEEENEESPEEETSAEEVPEEDSDTPDPLSFED